MSTPPSPSRQLPTILITGTSIHNVPTPLPNSQRTPTKISKNRSGIYTTRTTTILQSIYTTQPLNPKRKKKKKNTLEKTHGYAAIPHPPSSDDEQNQPTPEEETNKKLNKKELKKNKTANHRTYYKKL
ncbi:hypothetical protein EX30DRAFT_272035 [Ascodesmis nigricans]|uniref:Uncharacterized protein n=1 Tax=Ascodesmis nigricans TaxID=341454 RepID=A0A4S2MXH0_9PEZI|nr:hypothetical protein EX30DRAFT_272035 [Ascodesmis nigricans]